jgi:hypothetical protein
MAKMVKKAQNGIIGKIKSSWKKAGEDLKQADRDYKTSDSLRKLPMTGKTMKEKYENSKANRLKADSLFKAAEKRSVGGMKKGGKMIKKAQNGARLKQGDDMVSKLKAANKNSKSTDRKMGLIFDKKSFEKSPSYEDKIKADSAKKKAKSGGNFGMLSVKAGVDNNPSATFADKIAGAKKKAKFGKKMQYGGEAASMVPIMKKGGKAMYGKSMMSKGGKMKMGGKCKNGC